MQSQFTILDDEKKIPMKLNKKMIIPETSRRNVMSDGKASSSEPSRIRSSDRLYSYMLALVGISIFQMFLHESTYLKDHIEHLNSHPILNLKDFNPGLNKNQAAKKSDNKIPEPIHKDVVFISSDKIKKSNKKNDRNHALDILTRAGVDEDEVDDETKMQLPSLSEVESLYGSEPTIIGLDTCEAFRQTVIPEDAYLAPAGMFNTVCPSNYFETLLSKDKFT